MGYRSQVAYWFQGEAAQAVLMQHMTDHPNQECFDELTIVEDGVYFEASGVKWYNGYDYVDWHNQLYALASQHEDDMCGQFVRVGAESDDVQEESFGDPWGHAAEISVTRSMDFNFPTKK